MLGVHITHQISDKSKPPPQAVNLSGQSGRKLAAVATRELSHPSFATTIVNECSGSREPLTSVLYPRPLLYEILALAVDAFAFLLVESGYPPCCRSDCRQRDRRRAHAAAPRYRCDRSSPVSLVGSLRGQ